MSPRPIAAFVLIIAMIAGGCSSPNDETIVAPGDPSPTTAQPTQSSASSDPADEPTEASASTETPADPTPEPVEIDPDLDFESHLDYLMFWDEYLVGTPLSDISCARDATLAEFEIEELAALGIDGRSTLPLGFYFSEPTAAERVGDAVASCIDLSALLLGNVPGLVSDCLSPSLDRRVAQDLFVEQLQGIESEFSAANTCADRYIEEQVEGDTPAPLALELRGFGYSFVYRDAECFAAGLIDRVGLDVFTEAGIVLDRVGPGVEIPTLIGDSSELPAAMLSTITDCIDPRQRIDDFFSVDALPRNQIDCILDGRTDEELAQIYLLTQSTAIGSTLAPPPGEALNVAVAECLS